MAKERGDVRFLRADRLASLAEGPRTACARLPGRLDPAGAME
jgi:hypothetical protein